MGRCQVSVTLGESSSRAMPCFNTAQARYYGIPLSRPGAGFVDICFGFVLEVPNRKSSRSAAIRMSDRTFRPW